MPSAKTIALWMSIGGMHASANWHAGRRPFMAGIGRAGDTLYEVALEVPVYDFQVPPRVEEFQGAIGIPYFAPMEE